LTRETTDQNSPSLFTCMPMSSFTESGTLCHSDDLPQSYSTHSPITIGLSRCLPTALRVTSLEFDFNTAFCYIINTRHRASTSMYSLTFCVRVITPPQYGGNGTASLQITSSTHQARRFYRWWGEPLPACLVHAVGLAVDRWALPRISSVAIAMQPVHRLQVRPIVHNWEHPLPLPQVTSGSVQ